MRLLITGGYGFIGSNFINYYFPQKKCELLVNIDALYYCANELNVDEKIRNDRSYIFIKENLNNYNALKYILETYQITHIIHFAAQSHVQNSFEDSLRYTYDNTLGTHNLIEAVRLYSQNNVFKRFIHVSTDECYGESKIDINEKHKTEMSILSPTNPYAASKAAAEMIIQSYAHSFNLPIIITRGNNVFGRNQYPEKLIPKFIDLLKNNKKVTIQGSGNTIRAFLHAIDTAKAFECILERGQSHEIYNIGCDEGMEYSVFEVAKMLIKKMKNTDDFESWVEYIDDRPFNDARYYISNEKLKSLGWNITIKFEDGLNDLIYHSLKK